MSYTKKKGALNKYNRMASESEVAYASPHRLVQMLMEGALDKIATAKGQIERNDLAGKSRHISWASSIILGLKSSLDLELGGEIAVNLDDLYGYMVRRLNDANIQNSTSILDEITDLLLSLKNAWDSMPEDVKRGDAKSAVAGQHAATP